MSRDREQRLISKREERPSRREFLKAAAISSGVLVWGNHGWAVGTDPHEVLLPEGTAPAPVVFPHFPTRLHAFVWRNWPLVATERMAATVGGSTDDIRAIGLSMGLGNPPRITDDQWRRSGLTIIRRNWHLLPYSQLLALLGWSAEKLAFTLREDDFLYIKLGSSKPACEAIRYAAPNAEAKARAAEIAGWMGAEPARNGGGADDPLFSFVAKLSAPPERRSGSSKPPASSAFSPRYCYSYFALYGDPLSDEATDPYPDGYMSRLAAAGIEGVWLQATLYKLVAISWDTVASTEFQPRLANLRALTERARRHGLGVYLYLNEPRAMPLDFFRGRTEMQGVTEGDHAALCTSSPKAQAHIVQAMELICRAAPDLAGLFTITGSENLTHCWSHGGGSGCPRCGKRAPAEVIAELNGLLREGIRRAGTRTQLIAWDWGWQDAWVEGIIERLPADCAFMSVSEWGMPIHRGGVDNTVGEYSISVVGPGERARARWSLARRRGLKTIAKIQAGNTWELSAVPYIPAVENIARHAANLRGAGVDGLMLGWTLGGYPSPNLEVAAEIGREPAPGRKAMDVEAAVTGAMDRVASRRYGSANAAAVVAAWRKFSAAFSQFPFDGGLVYNAPMQFGPSNLLWSSPTGYHATMIGFPYDDLDGWRQVYPAGAFIRQFESVADGFAEGIAVLKAAPGLNPGGAGEEAMAERRELELELNVAEAAEIHFRSTATQARFCLARRALAGAKTAKEAIAAIGALESALNQEMLAARRLRAIQARDSRIGFEASNQYYYTPIDLAEKVVNCRHLLARWLPAERAKWEGG